MLREFFRLKYIKPVIESLFTIESFSYISDDGSFFENINIEDGEENNFNCFNGCSIFKLKKRKLKNTIPISFIKY